MKYTYVSHTHDQASQQRFSTKRAAHKIVISTVVAHPGHVSKALLAGDIPELQADDIAVLTADDLQCEVSPWIDCESHATFVARPTRVEVSEI